MGEASQDKPDLQTIAGNQTMGHVKESTKPTAAPKMFPLVLGLATDCVRIAVTCRALGFSKHALFKWRANPVSIRHWDNALLTNAVIDLHRDDPGCGYRIFSDEIEVEVGLEASERRTWRLCS